MERFLVLDTQTFSIVDTIPVTGEPWDVAVSPDGQWVYTGDRQSGVISVIDVQTHAVQLSHPAPTASLPVSMYRPMARLSTLPG